MKRLALILSCLALLTVARAAPPNILFLLTDDQDVTAHSLDYMPKLDKLLRGEGIEFLNYFVPTGLCCPSRSTIISGQFCHNTGIWDNGDLNNDTYMSGGFKKVIATGLENVTVATVMKEAGYETYLIGKYLNGYDDKAASHVPPGWDHWHGMTDTAYYGPHFSVDGTLLKTSKDTYQTDYISQMAMKFLQDHNKDKPFFLYVAPFAPHAPSTPAKRHESLFPNITAPRYASYNPPDNVQKEKPSWLKILPPLDNKQLESIDEFYRNRLRALQAVDEMLENVTTLLDQLGMLQNTYIFYMGDNGQHLGDYRLPAGKRQAYDTDVRVPFLVRGPGITRGRATEVVMSVDLFPTWAALAGGSIPAPHIHDGESLVKLLSGKQDIQPEVNKFRTVALTEMFGGSSNMGSTYKGMPGFEKNRFWNNTYQSVRIINGSDWAMHANWMYAEWCTGEREFYNVTNDPHEISNLAGSLDSDLMQKLSTLLASVADCKGQACWDVDFGHIARLASHQSMASINLRCFNPPDMPGESKASQTGPCTGVFQDGFPFADSDRVPEELLEEWRECSSQGYN